MKIQRVLVNMSVASLVLMAPASAALADSVAIDETGPNSNNQVTINNSVTSSETNLNVIEVANSNVQGAASGDVSADNNTTVGGLGSGAASNQASTSTSISIGNGPAGGAGQGPGGSGGNGGGNPPVGGLGAGGVLGVGGFGAGGLLPEVGASIPMDVSALRALYNPSSEAPTTNLAKNAGISLLFLAMASLLSLLGAGGTALYARRQELKA